MKTTINVDDALLKEAMHRYGVATKTRIIELGLEELIKADKRYQLSKAFGSQPALTEPRRRR